MESISQNIELLLDDLKRVTALLEDAATDAELLDSQPYQQARILALRQHLFDIDVRMQNLRRALVKAQHQSNADFQEKEQPAVSVGV